MKRAIAALVLVCATNAAVAGTLSTAASTAQLAWNAGVYLDLTPTVDLKVYSIDTRVATGPVGSPVTLYVYTCNTGTYVGNDATAANWTQVAAVNAYSNFANLTRFTFKNPLVFPAGVTRGVLLWSPNGLRYTGATGVQTFNNADLTLFSERVRNTLFGGTVTTPRIFAGNINYVRADQIEGAGEIEPHFVEPDCSTRLTVSVFPATSPASTGITVTADLSAIDGSTTQALVDDGTSGDAVAGDNVFSFLAPVPNTVTTGLKAIPFSVSDQNGTYNSNLSVNLTVVSDQAPKFISLPRGNQDTGGAAGINTLIRDQGQPRTAQMAILADELKTIPVGAKIDALSFRMQPAAANNGLWPPADLHYANYDVKVSKLAAGLTIATMNNTTFAANVDAGSEIVARSGPLTLPKDSLPGGAAQPAVNPWHEFNIDFTTPYVYDGSDLVITISHDGFDAVGTRFLDAAATTHAGFGTRFKCIAANAYNATGGAAIASMTILRLKYHTDLSGVGTITPAAVEQNCNALLTVQVTPGSSPASTNITVVADTSAVGGSPGTPLFDDGTNGDVTQNDNIYSLQVTVPGAQPTGSFRIPIVIEDDQCRIDDAFANVKVVAPLSGIPSATPSTLPAGCQTLITVAVTPAICSTSTNISVVADLAPIGGSGTQTLFDNATNGDQVAGDMIYSYLTTIPGSLSVGPYSGTVTITDNEGHIDQPSYNVNIVSPFANGVAAASPVQSSVGSPVKITLNLNLLSCAASTNRTVSADLSLLGGSSTQAMLDNGVAPDDVANDNIHTTSVIAPAPDCATYEIAIVAQDNEGHVNNFTAVLVVSPAGQPILFNSGPIVTHPGGGANGANLSALQNQVSLPYIPIAMNILGFGGAAPGRSADDFVICDAGGWNISSVTIYAYQTGSPLTSTITNVTLRIWDGVPGAGGSNVVFGDTTTNVMTATCWTGTYRATLTDPLGATRPVMACVLNVNTSLPPGRYWIDYSMSGSVASGPFSPPITRIGQPNTGNGMGSADGITYAALIDNGGSTATYRSGLPFLVRGTAASAFLLGDMDCSGTVNGRDISPFAGVLVGTDTDASHGFIADVNQDGLADLADIDAMTDLLLN